MSISKDAQHRPAPVAIIGIGCLFPGADNIESYWANLQDGVDAITDVPATHWRPEDYFDKDPKKPDHTYAARGGFLSPVDFPALEMGISPNVLEATDTTQLLGLLVAKQALDVAGYGAGREFDRSRVSVILGVTGTLELVVPLGARLGHPRWKRALKDAGVDDVVAQDVVQRIADSYVGWQEDSFPGLLGNVVAGRIANRLDLGGTNCVVDAACASSLSALHLGLLELSAGRADMVIAGGMDTFNDIFMYMCFSKTPALSPTGNAKPFDSSADGTILGEGLGCVLLKRLDDAERDGDKIFAVIRSVGTSSDGKGQAIYAPSPKGQTKALRQAYRLADVTPEMIELVEAHGTGTKAGDAAELTALVEVYRNGVDAPSSQQPSMPWCALGSVKSQIGHTKAAAGVAGLIKAALALHHKVLPPTIKVTQPIEQVAPGQTPFYVNTQKRPWLPPSAGHPRRAAVSAFGFGGSNFHCVLEEYTSAKAAIDWDPRVQIVAFSAQTPEELRQRLAAWPTGLAWDDLRIEAARTRARFFGKHRYRLTIVVERDKKSADELVACAKTQLEKSADKESWSTPDGIYFGRGNAPGKLAILFPGQGSQYVGMMRDLICRCPQLQASLAEANASFAKNRIGKSERRLSDFIYPVPTFRDEDRKHDDEALCATDVAQPALGAMSVGALRVLEHFHIRPDAVAGHSYGELTALCAAGRIDAATMHTLSQLRGRLMAHGTGDRGGMLAVRAPLADVEAVIREENLELVLANRNAPSQAVLSGSTLEIVRAREIFERRKIDAKPLAVAAAFHSPFVAEAKVPFRDELELIEFRGTDIAVYANTTAQEYPREPHQARGLLSSQLAEPVKFVEQIQAMYHDGARTFVEVGPGRTLSGLVAAILDGQPHETLTIDASVGKRPAFLDLARVLAHLAALGYRADLVRWDEGQAERKMKSEQKPTLTVPICGANYVKPKEARPAVKPVAKPITQPATKSAALAVSTQYPSVRVTPPSPSVTRKAMSEPLSTVAPTTIVAPTTMPADGSALAMTQDNLIALQRLAEQTAQLHRQFLEGQDRALQVFQSLLDQQNQLMQAPGAAVRSIPRAPAVAPRVQTPAPVSVSRKAPVIAQLKPQVVAPAPVITAAPVVQVSNAKLESTLLEVVSAKTGYPSEMLQLDMELDTDLGIDSIKRVEIFAILQEKLPDAPPVKAEHLGTLRTLRQVVSFLAGAESGAPLQIDDCRLQIEKASQSQADAANHQSSIINHQSLPAGPSADHATAIFMEVVSQKTGYPPEMLQLDMELDTDLGIDSIKRVEIFALLQEKLPEAPTVKAEHLGTLRTIRQVIDFIAQTPSEKTAFVHSRGSEYLTPGLELGLQLTKEIAEIQRLVPCAVEWDEPSPRESIDLATDAEIWVTAEGGELAERIVRRLDLLGYRSRLVAVNDAVTMTKPDRLAGLVIVAPEGAIGERYFLDTFALLQRSAGGLRHDSIFTTVTRLGGAFGLSGLDADADPVSGGLAGLAKTASHEWPEVNCKAIDLANGWDDLDDAAFAIVEEISSAGPVEVGMSPRGRLQLQLRPEAATPATRSPLQRGDVVVVTGGARGVTAETAVALARAFAPTLVLLGRSAAPTAEPTWLASLTQESDIKRALLTQMNGQATPKEVGERYQSLSANREILATLKRIESAGAKAVYRQVDVRNADAVRAAISAIRSELGPIRGLVHGAGVLDDHLIVGKTVEGFERVYATKVASLTNLLSAVKADDLRVLALFSSSTARFGRTGQADYAVANEVLNKLAQREAIARPTCRVVSLNWGPWDGGMVNAALKKVFANEGVGVIPLQAGGEFFVREISQAPSSAIEVVVIGSLPGELVSKHVSTTPADKLAFERDLSVDAMPMLKSHVIKGHPVLPMALAIEWLAHGALHANPGLTFHGFDDLRVLKGIIVHDDQPLQLSVLTGEAIKKNNLFRVPVEIRSQANAGRETPHVRAIILLASKPLTTDENVVEIATQAYPRGKHEIYTERLFHGPDLQGIETVEGCSEAGIVAMVASAPSPSAWVRQPLRGSWLTDPLVLDCGFQMMILWTQELCGAGSLPSSAGRYRQFARTFPRDGVRIVARITKQSEHRAVADLDFVDRAGKLIARMNDYECVIDASLNQAFRLNQLNVNA
ncbi:MAG: SDR family NAD(P)-dependent oxidoreductase [Gemmataceae bacterium]|nr:SDR family NAD(P)-dependent oxidoreductase [Gemmataceae bacterium]